MKIFHLSIRRAMALFCSLALCAVLAAQAQPSQARGSQEDLGQRVIKTAVSMCNRYPETIQGGCWDFVNLAYYRAGFPPKARQQVFLSKMSGPYADPKLVKPGDWLYVANHSVIFVSWGPEGLASPLAYVLDHPGEMRSTPGTYRPRSAKEIWGIFRPKAEGALAAIPDEEQ